jgi:aspartate racemase
MARGLERAGAELLVMPCNTAHTYAADIRAAVSIPFIDLIEAVADAAVEQRPSAVGLIAADGCLAAGLYQDAFAARGTTLILPDAATQAEFMAVLYRVKQGDLGPAVRTRMRQLAETLIAAGAQVVIAGCTEATLVLGAQDIAVPMTDSLEVLARRTVEAAFA